MRPNAEMREIFEQFQIVLRDVLPPSIGFQRLEIRMPEVVCVTGSGNFSLDARSGGINAVFSIAWQIHMFAHDKETFVVTIDEPENHLHPSMQRTFLVNLARAFPRASIIAATHSPFVVSSFPEAKIYALYHDENRRVISELVDVSNISKTPNDVLRDVLDVDSNLPVWVIDRISGIIDSSAQSSPTERARLVMSELERLGIADALSEYKHGGRDAKTP